MRHLHDLLQPSRLTSVLDVGANPINGAPVYTRMMEEGLCHVTAIDPQGEAVKGATSLRYVVGDGSARTLNICRNEGMTSLRTLSRARSALFPMMAEFGEIIESRPVQTTRLDDIDVGPVDLLKMDIQGGEIDVLRYGRSRLSKAVAIMTEVSFVPLYSGQLTFGEMDMELRHMGFMPHCFVEAKVWPLVTATPTPNASPHQLLEADMLYIRDLTHIMGAEQWKHLALIAHHICGSFDLAMRCVEELAKMDDVVPETAPEQYRQMLEAI